MSRGRIHVLFPVPVSDHAERSWTVLFRIKAHWTDGHIRRYVPWRSTCSQPLHYMYFGTALFLTGLCPSAYGKASFDHRSSESADLTVEIGDVGGALPPCAVCQVVGMLFKDMMVPVPMGSCQRRSRDIPARPRTVRFGVMGV